MRSLTAHRGGELALLLLTALAPIARAQTARGSRNLPVDHWAYEYIGRLRNRGHLENLNPLVQPYRRAAIAQALAESDTTELAGPVRHWIRLLRDEFKAELDAANGAKPQPWGAELTAGTRASTSRRFDPARATGSGGVWPRYTTGAWFETGPVAVDVRLAGDTHLNNDPDGLDPGQRRGGRSDNAYLSVVMPFGALSVGRFKQNWHTVGHSGLLVSDIATSYPQVTFELNAGRFTLRSLFGELDTLLSEKRYLTAHRVDYQGRGFVVSFGESIVYASPTGGVSLRYLNPLELLFFDHDNEPTDATPNLMLDAQLWFSRGPVSGAFEFLLDDIDITGDAAGARVPARFAAQAELHFVPRGSNFEATVRYEIVSAFAYRTALVTDGYTFLERGLGANYADYDRLSLTIDWHAPIALLRLSPVFEMLRQGEGDIRAPATDFQRGAETLFLGVRETTYRIALAGRYQLGRRFWLAWNAGGNVVRNAGHLPGAKRTEFAAMARGAVTLRLP